MVVAAYRLERALVDVQHPVEWGEWASWWVVDADELPVGFVREHRELVEHNTWGPPTYTASHNPMDHNGEGNPVWQAGGFDTPQLALAALVAQIKSGGDSV